MSFLFLPVCALGRDVLDEIGPFNPALGYTEEVDRGYRLSRRHRLVLTWAVCGRHDHDHEPRGLLRTLFDRGRLRIPRYAWARRFGRGFEAVSRAWGSLAAFAALPALALPALFGPGWAGVPIALPVGTPPWFTSRSFRQLYDAATPVESTALRGTV